ncbi:MAG TPA: DsbA family protein [Candidatus Sulfotelmatobacter sp.]|nr:DsbA family protein [Candidatus Sulfotelmatobacter sp.]
MAQAERVEVKMYSDFKSPYAFLAFDPAFALEERYRVRVRWIPFQLRIKGKGQRSVYSEYKVKYSYLDARRWANLRGGIVLKGPLKIYDTTPALVGGLYAEQQGRLLDYGRTVFERFFKRELEVDQADAVAGVIEELGLSAAAYRAYLGGEGMQDYERAQDEASGDKIFGVPILVFQGEPFWGNDRIDFLERRLCDAGLAKV